MKETKNNSNDGLSNYIYIVGEQQTAIIPMSKSVFEFSNDKMKDIETKELELVVSSVFGKGQFFPGPPEALTSIIHEFVSRTEEYKSTDGFLDRHCIILTACKLLNGDYSVRIAAVATIETEAKLTVDDTEKFYTLLLENIPKFENSFTSEAYAQDSKMVSILKDSLRYHQEKASEA